MRRVKTLPKICIAATGRTTDQLLASAQAALRYTSMVEMRLDWLPDPLEALPHVASLLASHRSGLNVAARAVVQATCRRKENGGQFDGALWEQTEILQKAAAAGCAVVDLEIESAAEVYHEGLASLSKASSVILSFHDFEKTPPLDAMARHLRRFPADFYKMVTTATRQSDNCAALNFLSGVPEAEQGKWIVFCMGEAGIPSRVLAVSRGSATVYATLPKESGAETLPGGAVEPSAPGQLSWDMLRNSYRAHQLTSEAAVFGLLGCPVKHSVGAALHNTAFRAKGLDAVYVPLLAEDLRDFRKASERYPLAGFSVTIPHKQKVLRSADRADRIARAVGAANTVRVRKGRWEATNTDVEGIAGPLKKHFRQAAGGALPRTFNAVIVGAGGAARAAMIALRSLGCRNLAIAARNRAKAAALSRQIGGRPLALPDLARERFDLLVHATPVGMWPQTRASLIEPEQLNVRTVFDLVYNPPETRLLQIARERGCRVISGLEMFLTQAALQFEYWTGQEAPRNLMRKIALQELQKFHAEPDESAGPAGTQSTR